MEKIKEAVAEYYGITPKEVNISVSEDGSLDITLITDPTDEKEE